MLAETLNDPRRLTMLALIGAAAVFIAALISQYGFGWRPCVLCLWQRYPYAIGGALALGGLMRPAQAPLLWGLASIAFLANVALAAFHSGVEFGWWEGFASCSAPDPGAVSAQELFERLQEVSLVRCDDRTPFLFELTMTNWNLLVCAGFAALLGRAAMLSQRHS